jgi:hypothetical protein
MRGSGFLIVIIASVILASCTNATNSMAKKESLYAPVEASLCNIDQKVANHFLITGVPEGFNRSQYETAVKEVCYSNPSCKSQAQAIFDSYGVDARKIDDMFSVMLCDKEMKYKIMEHFSCNNMRVQDHSWKMGDKIPCDFNKDWELKKQEICN